ncbi:Na+/H+ antiporter NhaA [Novosphingobium sp. TCA1]|uniref:Na+/H+ antiporter NhaA n=1 Tax=Novosphingobium sp. TCA1 TaxID=2682474 RepID=UPI0013074D36|nr:Na+/H+ antiporter NhaA [Novosphingobium sp. TCA1]GFE76907.1 hypothetical protein NTCA1_45560 [Novosphingobium sp. TCA1]
MRTTPLERQSELLPDLTICSRIEIATRPSGATWTQTYAICLLWGIGFAMSLIVGVLVFFDLLFDELKIGVLGGSTLSALAGLLLLWFSKGPAKAS